MAEDFSQYSNEELINRIKELKKQLNDEKYGLFFDRKTNPETVINTCKGNIPLLRRVDIFALQSNGIKDNLLIEGDNYHALLALNMINNGNGLVDVIYIDPPYNTGNKDFMYNDRYVDGEDSFKHSKWLAFMEKRLILAKDLLKDDGIMYLSIDDNEQANLKLLCDKIMGEDNFLACLVVNSAPAGTQSSTDFATQHSYCLVYRKSSEYSSKYVSLTTEEISKKYNYGKDSLGRYYIERIWKRGIGGRMQDVPSLHFPVYYNEITREIFIDKEADDIDKNSLTKIIPYQTKNVLGRWTWSREKMINEKDHLIVVKVANEWKLHKKVYEHEEKGKKPYSIIGAKIGRTELGSLELKNILGKKTFDYPKYSGFIKYLLSLHYDDGGTVLDFFAGSGTTGHAVLELNKEDGGNRKFILVTNNEGNIMTDVCYPRIKTVITGIRPDGTKYSDGIPANVQYFKTAFIEDDPSKDQAKYNLVEHCNDLLCILEDTFILIKKAKDYYIYKDNSNNKLTAIYFDYYKKDSFIEMTNEIKKLAMNESVVYLFSLNNEIDENEEKILKDNIKTIDIKPVPAKIYEIYKKIVDDLKRDY